VIADPRVVLGVARIGAAAAGEDRGGGLPRPAARAVDDAWLAANGRTRQPRPRRARVRHTAGAELSPTSTACCSSRRRQRPSSRTCAPASAGCRPVTAADAGRHGPAPAPGRAPCWCRRRRRLGGRACRPAPEAGRGTRRSGGARHRDARARPRHPGRSPGRLFRWRRHAAGHWYRAEAGVIGGPARLPVRIDGRTSWRRCRRRRPAACGGRATAAEAIEQLGTVEVRGERTPTAGGVLARHPSARAARQELAAGTWRAEQRLARAGVDPGGRGGFEVALEGPAFARRDARHRWEIARAWVDGVEWRSEDLPDLPLIEPERRALPAVRLRLEPGLALRAARRRRARRPPCWELAFTPARGDGGAREAWLDRETFGPRRARGARRGPARRGALDARRHVVSAADVARCRPGCRSRWSRRPRRGVRRLGRRCAAN